MVEALLKETVIPIEEARNCIPGTPSRVTLDRWIRSGKLESFKAGFRRFTSKQACQRFCERSTAGAAV